MILHAQTALLPEGWASNVRIIVTDGRIADVIPDSPPEGDSNALILPAPANLHSHTFQRAMAGLTEARTAGQDSFWTWRALMYRFVDHLTPEDVEAIAALAMIEMAEAGYAAAAEFHYLHHQPGGAPYANPAELSARIAAAAVDTGLGLTLLPVLYEQGGCDGRALAGGQLRFGCDLDRFQTLHAAARSALSRPDDAIGVAPHSLRAVSRASLAEVSRHQGPIHLHLAEQVAEVAEVQTAYGARPVEWALANLPVDQRWCMIHATQMKPFETAGLAATHAVAGLCPITEANLGDGIFDGPGWQAAGGRLGVGTDSNVQISLTGELRMLEYSQRLGQKARAVLADASRSTGRVLLDASLAGGAQAAGRRSGAIAPGLWADLMAPDTGPLDGLSGDTLLDAWIFATPDRPVANLWSAGRHIVRDGRHIARERVETRYRSHLAALKARA
ncbi:formimidoylglutamate deiminase [Tabrizicola sp. BL-A-41-H6]|uniref:formimidoylglutamate deiminase n=1 Tax=Tabrizicola sp. BL-A-41-H6 TaxID=3421107 RepID=UPI003D67730A